MKMNQKLKLVWGLVGGFAGLSTLSHAVPVSHYVKLSQSYEGVENFSDEGFRDVNTLIIYRPTFTLSNRWALTPDIRNTVIEKTGTHYKTSLEHNRFETNLVDKQFAQVGSQKIEMQYTLRFPTTEAAQKEGVLVTLAVRPNISFDCYGFGMKLRNQVIVPLQRTHSQKRVDAGDVQLKGASAAYGLSGNTLLHNTLELIAESPDLYYKDLKVGVVLDNVNRYKGASQGSTTNYWNNELYEDFSIQYSGANVDNYELGLGAYYLSKYGHKSSTATYAMDFWKKEGTGFYFEIAKAFD